MKASVVVPIRVDSKLFEPYLGHFRFCAEALAHLDGDKPEVVVLDYGSKQTYSEKIKSVADFCRQEYYKVSADRWSRAAAINRGIEKATGDLILVIDADVIVPPHYVQSHTEALETPGVFTNNAVYHLDAGHPMRWQHNRLVGLPGKICPGGWSHCGFRKTDWERAGGYDEDYYGWGGEDDSFLRRLSQAGLRRAMLGCVPIHLWHEEYILIQQRLGNKDLAESAARNYKRFHEGSK